MTEYQAVLDQLRAYTLDYVPPSLLSHAGWVTAGTLVAGLLISVLGARLARFAITGGFIVVGGMVGSLFAATAGLHPAPCVAVASLIIGVVGFMTYRLWAGVVTALVFSTLVMTVFGYQRVAPHLSGFDPEARLASASAMDGAQLAASLDDLPAPRAAAQQWLGALRGYLHEKDARLEQNGWALALGTALVALFVGVVAVRYALIVSTALVGTSMVAATLLSVCHHAAPQFYSSAITRPGVLGIAAGAFLVTSLLLQFVLTRPARAEAPKKAPAAA